MKQISVLLADDHQIVREGLRLLLSREPDLTVVGEAENGRQAVQMTRQFRPAVVVMDIAMPLLNGLQASVQIHKFCPDTRVIMLSAHSDDAYVEQVSRLGVAGYLLKQTSSEDLASAIRVVEAGGTFFSPAISRRLQDRAPQPSGDGEAPKRRNNHLSSREVEVLQLIAEGLPNRQVAVELGVSFKTVDKHRQHLMSKLNIHDVAGLTRYAIAEGIIRNDVRVILS